MLNGGVDAIEVRTTASTAHSKGNKYSELYGSFDIKGELGRHFTFSREANISSYKTKKNQRSTSVAGGKTIQLCFPDTYR